MRDFETDPMTQAKDASIKAWDEGHAVGLQGLGAGLNPYPPTGRYPWLTKEWMKGYMQGAADLLTRHR